MKNLEALYESILATEAGPSTAIKKGLFNNVGPKSLTFGKYALIKGQPTIKMTLADAVQHKVISTQALQGLKELRAYGFDFNEVYLYLKGRSPGGSIISGRDAKGEQLVIKRVYGDMSGPKVYYKDRNYLVSDLIVSLKGGGVKTSITESEIISQMVKVKSTYSPSVEGVDWVYENGLVNVITPCSFQAHFQPKPVIKIGAFKQKLSNVIPFKFGVFNGDFYASVYSNWENLPYEINGLATISIADPKLTSPLKQVNGTLVLNTSSETYSFVGTPNVKGDLGINLAKVTAIKDLNGLPDSVEDFIISSYSETPLPLAGMPNVKGNCMIRALVTEEELRRVQIGDKVTGKIMVPAHPGDRNLVELPNRYIYTKGYVDTVNKDSDWDLSSL